MGLGDGTELSLELGSLAGVVCQLSFGVGGLLLDSSQLAAQACLAPLQAVSSLPVSSHTLDYTLSNEPGHGFDQKAVHALDWIMQLIMTL